MTINEPASWLVSSFDCPYDLDNIILDDLPSYESILHAKFQLDHILVEGIFRLCFNSIIFSLYLLFTAFSFLLF